VSDKALSAAEVFGWRAESPSRVPAAPSMPQAAFPLHKAKTAREEGQDGEEHLLPTDAFPSLGSTMPVAACTGSKAQHGKSQGHGEDVSHHPLHPASPQTLGTQPTKCDGTTGPMFTGARGAGLEQEVEASAPTALCEVARLAPGMAAGHHETNGE